MDLLGDDENSTGVVARGVTNDERDEELAKWEIVVLTTILVITILGNGLVLLTLYIRRYYCRRKFTRMYFFIMHLSIADLLTGLLDVLPQLAWDITFRFRGGPILCKLIKFGQPLGPYLSSYVLMATAIDRYHAICHPLSYCSTTSKRSRAMVYCAWALALLLCLPQVFVFSYVEVKKDVWDCWAIFDLRYGERTYVTWYSVTVFLLPLLVLIYTYTGICVGIWRSNKMSGVVDVRKSRSKGTHFYERNRSPFISKAMINTVRQTIAVISLYTITSTPFIGCLLWATWDPNAYSNPFFTGATFTILALLSSLTSCVNPWIYLAFNRELRNPLINCIYKRQEYSLTYDREIRRTDSNETPSSRSSFISRFSRLASTKIFR